jgi:hypothetical protein
MSSNLDGYKFSAGSASNLVITDGWFVDADQRYALFRGANLCSRSKRPPYLPFVPLEITSLGQMDRATLQQQIVNFEAYIDTMQQLGFNVVRLLVMWKGVEPTHDDGIAKDYLDALASFIRLLYARGFLVFIDFHQDNSSDLYAGDGFPDWAVANDPDHPIPKPPIQNDNLWGLRPFDLPLPPLFPQKDIPFLTSLNALVRKTQVSFWENSTTNDSFGLHGAPTRDRLSDTIGQTAAYFAGLDDGVRCAILGYEPFNEPDMAGFPGDKSSFESTRLFPFYQAILDKLRKVDSKLRVFAEPRVDWNIYPASSDQQNSGGLGFVTDPSEITTYLRTDATGPIDDPKSWIFSFHFYDMWTSAYGALGAGDDMANKQREWPLLFSRFKEVARSLNMLPFLTEFGAQNKWPQVVAYLDLMFKQIEGCLLNATIWVYDPFWSSANFDNWNGEDFSILGTGGGVFHPEIIARPYPWRSSARPVSIFFDAPSKYGVTVLQGLPVAAPTVIFVPQKLQYKDGFSVRTTSNALKWDDQQQLLYWLPAAGETDHQLILFPTGGFDPSRLPNSSKALLPKTTYAFTFAAL